MHDHWQDWDYHEWNCGLFHAVFDGARSEQPDEAVIRIETTAEFIRAVTGDDSAVSSQAPFQAFLEQIRKQGDSPGDLLRLRRWRDSGSTDDEIPSYFGVLYFTLLVASGDEETHVEGRYRERMNSLLGRPVGANVDLRKLPELWEALRDWTHSRRASGHPIRPLELPHPRHERLIGYSKRLAFPGHRDLNQLARILREKGLDDGSPPRVVLRILGGRLSDFSGMFQEEYEATADVAKRSIDRVRGEPLWAAISAASWNPDTSSGERRQRIRIELDPGNPTRPAIHVLLNSQSTRGFGPHLISQPLGRTVEGANYFLCRRAKNDTEADLRRIVLYERSALGPSFAGTRQYRMLEQGLLPFLPGEAPWVDASSIPEREGCMFLANTKTWNAIRRVLEQHGISDAQATRIQFTEDSESLGVQGWHLAGPVELSADTLIELRRRLPDLDGLQESPRIKAVTLRDAVRLEDGFLLRRPVAPLVRAPGAEMVDCSRIDGSESHVLHAAAPEDVFELPPSFIDGFDLPAEVRFRSFAGGAVISSLKARFVDHCLAVDRLEPSQLQDWFTEAATGDVVPADRADRQRAEEPARRTDFEKLPPLTKLADRGRDHVGSLGLDEIPQDWDDYLECLHGILCGRRGIGRKQLHELITRSFRLDAEPWHAWRVLEASVQNGQVEELLQRRWSGRVYFGGKRKIILDRPSETARVTGLLSRLDRSQLRSKCSGLGLRASFATASGEPLMLGSILIPSCEEQDARELASETRFELSIRDKCPPLSSPSDILAHSYQHADRADPGSDSKKSVLEDSANGRRFEIEKQAPEGSQATFTLRSDGEQLWCTRSERWANLLGRWYSGAGRLSATAAQGATDLSSDKPLPLVIAQHVRERGRGVVGLNIDGRKAQWTYPFKTSQELHSFFSAWFQNEERTALDPAMKRWIASAFNVGTSTAQAMRRRYHSRDQQAARGASFPES